MFIPYKVRRNTRNQIFTIHMAEHHRTRSRGYSVVIHNTDRFPEAKCRVENYALSLGAKKYRISEEPYNHQDGTHTHIFIQFHNQKSKYNLLKSLEEEFRPTGDQGRIQVDTMRGSFEAATAYLEVEGKKKKQLGENVLKGNDLALPKQRTHNHIADHQFAGVNIRPTPKQKRNCPACQYNKWHRGLYEKNRAQWEIENKKPPIRIPDTPDYQTPRIIRAAQDKSYPDRDKIIREFKLFHGIINETT